MGYEKKLIDNSVCSRRFHVGFDPDQKPVREVSLKCPFCDTIVFQAENHPPAKILRQENLVQTAELSDQIVNVCSFVDKGVGLRKS